MEIYIIGILAIICMILSYKVSVQKLIIKQKDNLIKDLKNDVEFFKLTSEFKDLD